MWNMKRVLQIGWISLMAVTVAFGTAQYDFSRYQIIIDRKPFGEPPPPPPLPTKATPQAESFARNIRLSGLVEKDDGSIQVGFVDKQSNKSYFLSEGESEDGIELVSASYEDEEAVLQKGGEMAVIQLQSGEVQALSPAQQQERLSRKPRKRLSYAERRAARLKARQERLQKQKEQPKLTGDQLEKSLQDYQMEVLRQGLPPLPIPLTEEMDNQLVQEGVLPPVQ